MRASGWNSKSPAILIALVILFALSARSDSGVSGKNPETKKLCYCGCDSTHGAAMCTHMCELPKYQNRWWAATCRKLEREFTSTKPSPYEHSKKMNRKEQASLN